MRKEGEEVTEEHREGQSSEERWWWWWVAAGRGGGGRGSRRLPQRSPLEVQRDSPHGRGSRSERRPFFSAGPPR